MFSTERVLEVNMSKKTRLIVIEDNKARQNELAAILAVAGTDSKVMTCEEWASESDQLANYDAVLIGNVDEDNRLQNLVDDCCNSSSATPFVILGENTNQQYQLKAVAHLDWPFSAAGLTNVLYSCQAFKQSTLSASEIEQANQLRTKMVGNSPVMEGVRRLIQQVAATEASVLILGESGTGKEVAARNLHDLSNRCHKPFVPINCGAIPADLLESELFGHEKGAFTGALTARKGRFELAEGGTIFLDEIGDMPMPMQVKLLRVLQERTFEKVGSSQSITANVRIIAATHRILADEVKEGRFREDLFYRLNVFPIEMPPLRERVDDIAILVSVLVSRLESEKRGSVRLSPAAVQSLKKCQWAGNVRELANLIERLCILHPYGVADLKDLPSDYRDIDLQNSYQEPDVPERSEQSAQQLPKQILSSTDLPDEGLNLKEHIKDLEIAFIKKALDEEDWVVARAAKRLKMQRTTLVEKMRKYALQKAEC